MGDRGVIVVKCGNEIAPAAIYVHSNGYRLSELMREAAPKMRRGDPGYAVARLCGSIHEEDPTGITGLGLVSPPKNLQPATLANYSPGDAGVAVWDVGTGEITWHGGYTVGDKLAALYLECGVA